MKKLFLLVFAGVFATSIYSCRETTQDKTKDALESIGEDIETNAKKAGEKIWNPTSRRVLINFLIPLITGGIFALLLLKNKHYGLIAPVTLLFYGLACLNASKYTLRDVRYLGITQIILGLIAVEFSGYGLYFWVIGFGLCHILYGSMMYYKYDRNI